MDMQEARDRYFEQGYFIVDDAVVMALLVSRAPPPRDSS